MKPIDEILYRYLCGQTNEAENERIVNWLDANPEEHLARLNKLHYLCTALDYYKPHLLIASSKNKSKQLLFRKMIVCVGGIAASILMLLAVRYLYNQEMYNDIEGRTTTLEAPEGQYFSIMLEDGTKVWLNGGSTMEYPPVFKRTVRAVKISGEAMFEVRHDAKRPFVVETFASRIEVTGTKFNVIADKDFDLFSTTLVEGKIKVISLRNPSDILFMQPYETVCLSGNCFHKTPTFDFAELCWTKGLIHIKKMPFDLLMRKFEKAYGIKININRQVLPEIDVMSGEIRVSDGIDNALVILQRLSDFTYTRNEEKNMIEIN